MDVLSGKHPNEELGELVRHRWTVSAAIVTQICAWIAAPGPASFKAVRSHDLLEHSLRLLKPHASKKLITLQKKYQATPDTVHGDDARCCNR